MEQGRGVIPPKLATGQSPSGGTGPTEESSSLTGVWRLLSYRVDYNHLVCAVTAVMCDSFVVMSMFCCCPSCCMPIAAYC